MFGTLGGLGSFTQCGGGWDESASCRSGFDLDPGDGIIRSCPSIRCVCVSEEVGCEV